MDRVGISGTGPGVPRRVDAVRHPQVVEKLAVAEQSPRTMQKHKRRPVSSNLDLGLYLALPTQDFALLDRGHFAASAASASAICCRGHRAGHLQSLRPPPILPLVVPQALDMWEHVTAEQVNVFQAELMRHRTEMQ